MRTFVTLLLTLATLLPSHAWTFGGEQQVKTQAVLNSFAGTWPPLSAEEREAERAAMAIPGAVYPGAVANLGAWYTASPRWLRTKEGRSGWSASNYLSRTTTDFDAGNSDFTVSVWVKLRDNTTFSQVVGNQYSNGWSLQAHGTLLNWIVCDPGNSQYYVGKAISSGVWYHVVAWREGTTIGFTINNDTPTTTSCPVTLQSSGYFWVGPSTAPEHFDQMQYWNRALTSDERTWLYNSGAGRNYEETGNTISPNSGSNLRTSLVSWYELNGTAVGADKTGNNPLTLSGTLTASDGLVEEWATSGAKVYRWMDRSGNGRDAVQATFSGRPSYSHTSSWPTVVNTNSGLVCSTANLLRGSSSWWLTAVGGRGSPLPQNYVAVSSRATAVSPRAGISAASGNANTFASLTLSDVATSTLASSTVYGIPGSVLREARAAYNAGAWTVSYSIFTSQSPTTTLLADVSTSVVTGVTALPNNYGALSVATGSNGATSDVLVYESAPTQDERNGVRRYLSYATGHQAWDEDAAKFFIAASVTNLAQRNAINSLVMDLKRDDNWDGIQALYPLVGGTSTSHSYNLKNPALYQITWTGGVTHDATGITGDASSGYGNTGLSTSSLNSASFSGSAYVRNFPAGPSFPTVFGASDSGFAALYSLERGNVASDVIYGTVSGASRNAASATSPAVTTGLLSAIATSSSAPKLFIRGIDATVTTSNTVVTPSGRNLFLLANNQGSAIRFSGANVALYSFGLGRTAAQEFKFNQAVQRFQTRLDRAAP